MRRFPNLAAKYHVNKAVFSRKFTLNGKCGCKILNKRYQEMQTILRYANDIVLFTINRYFTCYETVNLEQTWTIRYMNKDYIALQLHTSLPGHLCMTSHFNEVTFSRTTVPLTSVMAKNPIFFFFIYSGVTFF